MNLPAVAAATPASIRGRLLRWLVLLLLPILLAASLLDYRNALEPLEAAYDQALADAALAVAAGVHPGREGIDFDLSDESISVLRADTLDRIYFRVVGPAGRTIGGDRDLVGPGLVDRTAFFDTTYRGQRVRGVAHPVFSAVGPTTVLVAETTRKRDRARRDLIASRLVQDVAIVMLTLFVVWFAVGIALRPVERIVAQMRARAPGELAPVRADGAPAEVRPLIDALNRLLGQIGETQDGQRRFIENAAHQLRTPLAGLRGQVDLAVGAARAFATGGDPSPAAAQALADRLAQIGAAATRVTHLANQLLTLARSDRSSHDTASRQRVQLADLVTEAVAVHIDDAIAREQDLGAEAAPAELRAVAWELRELLANLVDNAIAHTPRGGRITIRSGVEAGAPFLEVEDSGHGIAVSERERVFERFYRGPGAAPGGAGLGLAIVREIAALNGGSVEIRDASPGPGTVVRVEFPSALRSPANAAPAET